MHSATTATGRPLPSSGKTLPKNRPAPLTSRAPRHPAAPKPHVTSQLQCYIPALTDNHRRSPLKINRQQMRTLHPAFFAGRATAKITPPSISNHHDQHAAPLLTNHYSPITTHSRSNRHTPRLENAISHRKQTLGTLSNRHFLQVSASHNHRIANANRPLQVASNIVSNRQWQILEISVNLSKQTIAPRSNRHKNALFASRLPSGPHRGPKGMGSPDAMFASRTRPRNKGSRVAEHGSRNTESSHQLLLTTHESRLSSTRSHLINTSGG